MKKLTILYDDYCGFCRRCRHWMMRQPAYVELEWLPAGSAECERRYPELVLEDSEELIVVSHTGAIYRGPSAYIICLYALKSYRELSLLLAKPWMLPFARAAFAAVTRNRRSLSRLLARSASPQSCAPCQTGSTKVPASGPHESSIPGE